jgi:hypothetical protein
LTLSKKVSTFVLLLEIGAYLLETGEIHKLYYYENNNDIYNETVSARARQTSPEWTGYVIIFLR